MQPRYIAHSARTTSSPLSQLFTRSPCTRREYQTTSRQSKAKGSFQAPSKPDFNRSPQASKQTPTISPSTSLKPQKAKLQTPEAPPPPSLIPGAGGKTPAKSASRIFYLPKSKPKPPVSVTKPKPTNLETSISASTSPPTTDPASPSDSTAPPTTPEQSLPQQGALADNSLFAEESKSASTETEKGSESTEPTGRDPSVYSAVLNPRPTARSRWQRKMVIRSIRRRGRLTKEEILLRTERSSLSKSHFFKTSMKKLAPLARQIAGKPIDEAILQMRYSTKKAARDVLKHLQDAKNESIVRSGMGLGLHTEQETKPKPAVVSSRFNRIITAPLETETPSIDPSQIYISQAWVNRGPYKTEPEYRARGRMNLLKPPTTGLSVLLKEERTRIRLQREKQEKAERLRRKTVAMGDGGMWTAMPDKKIIGPQNQSVLW